MPCLVCIKKRGLNPKNLKYPKILRHCWELAKVENKAHEKGPFPFDSTKPLAVWSRFLAGPRQATYPALGSGGHGFGRHRVHGTAALHIPVCHGVKPSSLACLPFVVSDSSGTGRQTLPVVTDYKSSRLK